jgi:hypothetical protein
MVAENVFYDKTTQSLWLNVPPAILSCVLPG